MTIYLDMLLLLNFSYDFLILLTVDITLKRNTKLRRIVLSSFIGALSIVVLFLPLNKILLNLVKFIISIIMVLVSFKYKNIKYSITNLFYLYLVSFIMAGFLYYLNLEFNIKEHEYLFMVSPIILYLYIYSHKKIKSTYNLYQDVKIIFIDSKEITCKGYIDSGNKLRDCLTKKYIIIINNKIIKDYINNYYIYYVPYKALNKSGLLECIKIKKIIINDREYTNYLLGISNNNFFMNGVDCLLNYKILEDIC